MKKKNLVDHIKEVEEVFADYFASIASFHKIIEEWKILMKKAILKEEILK
ncbi:hypothetical protein SMD22_00435 (plasmid) [Brevibacillus halotolerans]|nr:hypothetical protein SMD22_00435 [Brevibacillus halotolerans]